MTDWEPTRAAARARLEAFRGGMGRAYAAGRNFDHGPGQHEAVSRLSPGLRRRLVTEAEVVAAALSAHRFSATQKFVEEVCWRTYFKGWLEQRPAVWADYRAGVVQDRDALSGPALGRYEAAVAGRTGIAPFDAWAEELASTGYLHNHARMWAASIWCFTLGLPWRLGAEWFLRHLLDGDPASNTLSWRWVAGLHTVGKNYAARASNITKFTGGRFGAVHGLAKDPAPLVDGGNPARSPLRMPEAPDPALPTALLVTEEDLSVEDLSLPPQVVAVATLRVSDLRTAEGVAGAVADFDRAALDDQAARLVAKGLPAAEVLDHPAPGAIADWARAAGAAQVMTAYLPEGWVRERMLAEPGLPPLREIRRDWDAAFWPHATAGFFKVKKAIPAELRALGLPA